MTELRDHVAHGVWVIGLSVHPAANSGGYDYDFVDAIDSKYQCVICQCVLREARHRVLRAKLL